MATQVTDQQQQARAMAREIDKGLKEATSGPGPRNTQAAEARAIEAKMRAAVAATRAAGNRSNMEVR